MTCLWCQGLVRGEVEALTQRLIGSAPKGKVNKLRDDEAVPEVEAFYVPPPEPPKRKPPARRLERNRAIADARQRWIASVPHVTAALPMSSQPRLNVTFPKSTP